MTVKAKTTLTLGTIEHNSQGTGGITPYAAGGINVLLVHKV